MNAGQSLSELRLNLQSALAHGMCATNVPMADFTTFKIGGPVDVLVEPGSYEEACAVVRRCRAAGVPLRVIGAGSDLLVADEGLRGVVMRIGERLSQLRVEGNRVIAQAGATNAQVAEAACEVGLAGYEFASGIPGTIGGAAIMNAGAYDGEFASVCVNLLCIDETGEIVEVSRDLADWSYRHSMMDERGYVVLQATLELEPGDSASIRARIDELTEKRAEKQPLDMPSAGSTFKRPEGYFAGKLIQDAGLRGFRIGGAQVSEKHTGFVVNAGGATAKDVRALIEHVSATVLETQGVELHPEVRMWGFDD